MTRKRWITYLAAFAVAAVLASWLLGVFHRAQAQHLPDASQHRRLVFHTSDKHPSGVTVRVRGHIDGVATVTAAEDRWNSQQIGGDVDWSVYHDWFYSTCTLDYSPAEGTSGRLSFEVTFH